MSFQQDTDAKVYVAGHRGMVGSAIVRALQAGGFNNIVTRTSAELDLRSQAQVQDFFQAEKPDYVFLAAARVGGILANEPRQTHTSQGWPQSATPHVSKEAADPDSRRTARSRPSRNPRRRHW